MIPWKLEIKGNATDWHEVTLFQYRNVSGNACAGARLIDWEIDEVPDTADLLGPIPGVFKYSVKPGSIVSGVSAKLFMDVLKVNDLHHPYIDKTTGYDVVPNAWNNTPQGSDVMLFVSDSITASSVFEVGYGYEWNTAGQDWLPMTSFGVNFPGVPGKSAFIRVTNTTERDQVACRMTWSNTGSTPSLWRARLSDSDWQIDGSNELIVTAQGCLSGHVPPDASVVIEIQSTVPEGTTAMDNPVVGTFTMLSASI